MVSSLLYIGELPNTVFSTLRLSVDSADVDAIDEDPHDLLLNWEKLGGRKNPADALDNLKPERLKPTFHSSAFQVKMDRGPEVPEGAKLSNKISSHMGDDRLGLQFD